MNEVREIGAKAVAISTVPSAASQSGQNQVKEGTVPEEVVKPSVKVEVPAVSDTVNSSAELQEQVKQAVAQMNEFVQSTQRDLHFSFDSDAGETIVKVLDRETQEVIRQIPDQIFLKLAQQLKGNESIHLVTAQA